MTTQLAGERDADGVAVESRAVHLALAAGVIGGVFGLVLAATLDNPSLRTFGLLAAVGSAIVTAAASGYGYWRSRYEPGQEWRLGLSAWKFSVNTASVILAQGALAFLAAYVAFLVLSLGFIGLTVSGFWAVVLMGITLGLSAYITFLAASRMTTQGMSSLLMSFIVVGTLTAMVTTPDPLWWQVHFSQLGTFGDVSSWIFNGVLIAGGLVVTTFAVYLSNDIENLRASGGLPRRVSARTVSALFVVMGVMLACVGIFPVDVNLWLHNLSASGMAVMYLVLLCGGPSLLRGMPRTYFVASWAFLGALLSSLVLFIVGYFSLTAFEIIVFALIFGWIAVFIRFLAVTGERRSREARHESTGEVAGA